MTQYMDYPVGGIILDEATQSRIAMPLAIVEDYASAMLRGDTFPAVVLFQPGEDEKAYLGDGWYRVMAAKQAGLEMIFAEVHEGGKREAIWHAAGANEAHGLRRTNEDKRNAVLMLLEDKEWWKLSDRQIAEAARVSDKTVAKVRKEMNVGKSPHEGETRTDTLWREQPVKKKPKKKKAEPEAGSQEPAEPSTEDAQQIDMGDQPEEPVEARTVATVLNEIALLYIELPRSPEEAVDEAMAVGLWMLDQRADHIAWWFQTYAEAVRRRSRRDARLT